MPDPRPSLAVVAVLASLLAGCGAEPAATGPSTDRASATPEDAAPEGTEDAEGPEEQGRPEEPDGADQASVPDTLRFTATTVGGETFDGASLAGRPVLMWFWAPWCPTCRSQVPEVEGLAAEHEGELAVVGVGSLDSEQAIADFAGEVEGLTHLVDTEGELWQRFEIAEQSSYVLLDAEGRVALRTGYGGAEDLAAEVEGVLG